MRRAVLLAGILTILVLLAGCDGLRSSSSQPAATHTRLPERTPEQAAYELLDALLLSSITVSLPPGFTALPPRNSTFPFFQVDNSQAPGSVAGVLNLSGFVPDHPTVRPESATGLPVFWGHGTADGNVPYALARAGRAALQAGGADLHAWDFPGGHTITQEEVVQAEPERVCTIRTNKGGEIIETAIPCTD